MSKIRVLLTDDHTLFRKGIRTLLSREADIEVVGEAENGSQSVEKVAELNADVVLLDIGMPGLSSFEATRQIKKIRPETKILFLTMYDYEDYLGECMEVGGSGYVLKDSPAPQLLAAIRDIYGGGSYLSPKMRLQLAYDSHSRTKTMHRQPSFATLTPREKEIIKFLAEGQSLKEIATHLNVSVKTVEAHKYNLMQKLDIHNRVQLVHYAVRHKITIPTKPIPSAQVAGRSLRKPSFSSTRREEMVRQSATAKMALT